MDYSTLDGCLSVCNHPAGMDFVPKKLLLAIRSLVFVPFMLEEEHFHAMQGPCEGQSATVLRLVAPTRVRDS